MAGDLSDRLSAFLAQAEARTFDDGTWDCCLFPAAWVQLVTGIDGAAPWRGRYTTALGWARILRAEGGVGAVMARGAALAGLTATVDPRRGDIGVIALPSPVDAVGAVCIGSRWAIASRSGLAVVTAPVLAAWRVNG